jgi:hypothetical protein
MAAQPDNKLGPEFQYDLSALLKVDPKLVHYLEAAKIDVGLDVPAGIAAADDGRFFVTGDKAVRQFDKAGKLIAEFKVGAPPRAIALSRAAPDKASLIYLAMADHVEVFDLKGKRQAAWKSAGEKAYLTSVAVGENDVFVADASVPVVLRYDLAGKLLGRIGEKDAKKRAPGFVVPSPYFDVAVTRDNMLWVVNTGLRSVESYTYDGDFRFAWGKASPKIESFCGCCNPIHMAIMADGSFVTAEKGLPRVKVYDASGVFKSVVAPPSAFAQDVAALCPAVDSDSRVLVLDVKAGVVRAFAQKG